MEIVASLDERCGKTIYTIAHYSILRHLASLASLCVDEAVWFPVSLLLALLHVATAASIPELHADLFGSVPLQTFLEVFNNAVMLSCGAGLIKLLPRRERPTYAKQEKFFVTNGDKFSLPSGHTLFATVMMRLATGGPDTSSFHKTMGMVALALVGWSRVAKGRHYPVDVIVGGSIGMLLAEIPLRGYSSSWALCKLVVASLSLCEVLLAVASPKFRTPGFKAGALFLGVAFALLPFGSSPPLGSVTAWFAYPASLVAMVSSQFGPSAMLMAMKPSMATMYSSKKH